MQDFLSHLLKFNNQKVYVMYFKLQFNHYKIPDKKMISPLKCHTKFEEPNTKVLYNDMPTHNINF